MVIIPNMFFSGSIIFFLATKFKNTTVSFVGAMIIIIGYIASLTLASDIENEQIGALVDVFGINVYAIESKYYTALEKNTLVPSFYSILGLNRLIWVVLGLIVTAVSYSTFSFAEGKSNVKKEKKVKKSTKEFQKPASITKFSQHTDWIQFKSFISIYSKTIRKSTTFKTLIIFSVLLLCMNLYQGYEYFGLQSYPVTYKIMDSISAASQLFIIIIIVFYSGELIWQDREVHLNEVIDSSPHTTFSSLIAKVFSIGYVLTILYTVLLLIGILFQLLNGYTNIKIDVYIIDFLITIFPSFITTSSLMLLIHVLVNNKYIGYAVCVLFLFVVDIILNALDVSSVMLSFGSSINVQYSDMNSFGPGLIANLWLNAYWLSFSILLLLIAGLLYNRGTELSLLKRIQNASKNLDVNYIGALSFFSVIWAIIAGVIYYNTQVLNTYETSDQIEENRAYYEKEFKQYENVPQPKLTDVVFNVNIFPKERNVYTVSNLTFQNKTSVAIDTLFYTLNDKWDTEFIIPNGKDVFYDERTGFKKIALSKSLQPNDILKMTIKSNYITKGFENSRGNTSIIENGTFINNGDILPNFGYVANAELNDKYKRKEYDLAPKERVPALNDNCGPECDINYLTNGTSDWVNIETNISTSSDQIAIAPGSLVKEWKKDNRNFFTYKVDHVSQAFVSFTSARFEVARKKWKGIDIEIYYDAQHSVNIDKMLSAVERSLDYYIKNFGPYYHKQARVIEFPRYATFAQAFPGTMPYSEAFGFIVNLEDEEGNNVIDAVIAHEMAHQWWAHQEVGANVQGGTMLTESFSEYAALMVMKQTSTPIKMKEFLKYDLNLYLRGRSGETKKELPLYKVENQQYIHYGKGSVILYALQDYIGEDSVNAALSSFLEEFRYKEPPYPTSNDFLRHLSTRVPDSLNYLIDDWFKEITLYDYRLKETSLTEVEDSTYKVQLTIEARKIKADSIGNETDAPLNEWVDIGFFSDNEEKELFHTERINIDQKSGVYEFTLDQLPVKAGVDPKRLLIERVYDDNIKKIDK
ncbi:M1 family aminopeptidase [Flammeovirga kamogawensis]|nr:M1 family aminopeptidase [Flammeovirga kamogawensis]